MVKIEGCDYKISEEMLLSWLAEYGEVQSELVEDVFDDSEDSEGKKEQKLVIYRFQVIY